MQTISTEIPRAVSRNEWLTARKELLAREKALTRVKDEVNAARRELPMVRVEKAYVFDSAGGKVSLADCFEGRSQLVVKHFMFGPAWTEGCVGCSFECDHLDASLVHLTHHDVSVVAVSRAPISVSMPFYKRMGWRMPWLSSFSSDFNFDYRVSFTEEQIAAGQVDYNYSMNNPYQMDEMPGFSFFYKDPETGEVYHTNSAYGRGAEEVLATYGVLDLTLKGRNEAGPRYNLTDWVRHHDRYDAKGHVDGHGQVASSCSCTGGGGGAS